MQSAPTGTSSSSATRPLTCVQSSPSCIQIGDVQIVTDVLLRCHNCSREDSAWARQCFCYITPSDPFLFQEASMLLLPATRHVYLNRGVTHVKGLLEAFPSSNSDMRLGKAGAQRVKGRAHEWETSNVGCCPTAGPRYDCRDEGKKTNEATGRQWMSSHATSALKTTLSLFHREVKISLATTDATVGQSSVSGGEAMRLQIPSRSIPLPIRACGLSQPDRSGRCRLRR